MEIKMPELSETKEEVVVTSWYVKENDLVEKDQEIVEVVTDKATFDVVAPCDGKIGKIYKPEGSQVQLGESLGEIHENRS